MAVTIEQLKTIGLAQIAEHFNINLRNGRGDCPFCFGVKTMSVRENLHYRCYRAGCDKHGDAINLLIDSGEAADAKEAYRKLLPLYKGEDVESSRRRVGSLLHAFQTYQKKPSLAYEYMESRGIKNALKEYPVGYAPSSDWLQSNGFKWEEVKVCGLASDKQEGRELLSHHIVFPVRSAAGNLIHLQGRSLEPDATWDRWIATNKFEPPIASCIFGLDRLPEWKKTHRFVFLCEGLSDCYSLLELGLPAVATLGVQVRLVRHLQDFEGLEVYAIYDNDRYPLGHPLAGAYKSWNSIFPQLVALAQSSENIQIKCVMPPARSGIKDVNDFLNHLSWDKNDFLDHCEFKRRTLEEMAFFLYEKQPALHPLIVEAVSARKQPEYVSRLQELIGSDWIEFVMTHVRS